MTDQVHSLAKRRRFLTVIFPVLGIIAMLIYVGFNEAEKGQISADNDLSQSAICKLLKLRGSCSDQLRAFIRTPKLKSSRNGSVRSQGQSGDQSSTKSGDSSPDITSPINSDDGTQGSSDPPPSSNNPPSDGPGDPSDPVDPTPDPTPNPTPDPIPDPQPNPSNENDIKVPPINLPPIEVGPIKIPPISTPGLCLDPTKVNCS